MTDIEDRIAGMLSDAAKRVEVSRNLKAITDARQVRIVNAPAPSPRRRVSHVLAVASLGALLIAGLVLISRRGEDTNTDPAATAPATSPKLFPVIDDLPAWAQALYGSYRIPDTTPPPRAIWALLARDGNGQDVVDPIIISVQAEIRNGALTDGDTIDVGGRTARLITGAAIGAPSTLILDGTPALMVSGSVDQSLLIEAASAVSISDPNGDFTVSLGEPPAGFTVVTPPTVQPTPVLSAATSTLDGVSLDVAVDGNLPDPRLRVGLSGADATAASIGSVTGWYATIPSTDGFVVAWEPTAGTILVLTASYPGVTSIDVLKLARSVRLTNEDEWRAEYNVEANPLPGTRTPVIGEPMPGSDNCQTPAVTIDATACD